MMAIPVSGQVVPRVLRTVVVAAIAFAALGVLLQRFAPLGPVSPGKSTFYTSANVVVVTRRFTPANVAVYTFLRGREAGILPGDRIEYSRMPLDERYGDNQDGLRPAPIGKSVAYIVEYHGERRVVRLAALRPEFARWPSREAFLDLWSDLKLSAFAAIICALVLLGAALVLIRPASLTVAFLFLVASYSAVMPWGLFFLPPQAYAAVMAVSDTLAGLGPVGFLALALYLSSKRPVRSRQVIAAGALLLAVIVAPIAISDIFELMLGIRPAWPIAGWASFLALWFAYLAGIMLLLKVIANGAAPRTLRLLAGLLLAIGSMKLFFAIMIGTNTWYFANLPAVVMNRWPSTNHFSFPQWFATFFTPFQYLVPLGSLIAFYMIVRSKIVDTGPVLSRMIASIIIVLLVAVLFTLANIAFASDFPGYVLLVPIEIVAALAVGYWLSGLRDLAGSLSLASTDAWNSWATGYPRDERDGLAYSLRLAERTRRHGVIAEVRAQIAFSSWRDGDDAEFERNADALVRLLGTRNMRGLRGFALAATSAYNDLCFKAGDLPEWRARSALLLCARTDDAAVARQYAGEALASADGSGLASLRVLALVAVAETSPERRKDSLERAHAIARDAGWSALSKSILALRANSRDIGILQPFVEVRLRKSRPARPAFEISFFNAELRQNGTCIPLAENELELLLTVASAPAGANDMDLMDDLWPESDGDAARNAFRVCLYRLRKKSGDARIVARLGKGYVVHPWADVDLWRFQSLIAVCRERDGRDCGPELRDLCDALRGGKGRRATLGEWFHRFEQLLSERLDEAERLLDRVVSRRA
jgi:hypothetical protein